METPSGMMAYIISALEQAERITNGYTKNMVKKSLVYAPKLQLILREYEASQSQEID